MGLAEVMVGFLGLIVVSAISLIYWLIRPYSEPVVKEGKIVDKYEIKGNVEALTLSGFGEFRQYIIPDSFNILVLMENRDKTTFRISKEKYDALEVGDSVTVTEYSQVKRMVEKNSGAVKEELKEYDSG